MRVFNYWNKLIQMDDNRLRKDAFNIIQISPRLTAAPEKNKTKISPGNIEALNLINSKPKLITYRLFKDKLSTEGYVKYSEKTRPLMVQFRLQWGGLVKLS